MSNESIATIGSSAVVLDTNEERNLGNEVSLIEQKASAVMVDNDSDFANAGEITKQVKQVQKQVKEYWEPLRASAKIAYDSVLAHKKEMLDPLEKAESILKQKMSKYTMEKERQRREQEEAMRRLAQEEMNRKLEEAAKAEESGNEAAAEYAMAEAEVMERVSVGGQIPAQAPKAQGVSQSKSWKISGIDSSKVPVSISGVEIRPVDEGAIMRLIKASKGTIQIPGVKYEESVTISVRS